nr:MAG TPA: hypothetical protein [Microviridae sp.]
MLKLVILFKKVLNLLKLLYICVQKQNNYNMNWILIHQLKQKKLLMKLC